MPSIDSGFSMPLKILLGTASFFIIIAGLKSAQDLLVPFLVAVFIAIIAHVPMSWLKDKNVPFIVALIIVLSGVVGFMLVVGGYLGTSIAGLTQVLPQYESQLNEQVVALLNWTNERLGTDFSPSSILSFIEPSSILRYVTAFLNGLSGALTNATLIILYVAFMLAEGDTLPEKLYAILKNSDSIQVDSLRKMAHNVNQYLGLKTLISAITGLFIAIWLLIIGVEFPFLWGFIAFLLNYIPNVGSILAAIPAILMALVQLGWQGSMWTAAGFLVANVVMGNVVEPKVMGNRLGLSVFVVIVSLMFWGWVFGPVGMFLSVPLTLAIQVLLQSSHNTRWVSILISSSAPKNS